MFCMAESRQTVQYGMGKDGGGDAGLYGLVHLWN